MEKLEAIVADSILRINKKEGASQVSAASHHHSTETTTKVLSIQSLVIVHSIQHHLTFRPSNAFPTRVAGAAARLSV